MCNYIVLSIISTLSQRNNDSNVTVLWGIVVFYGSLLEEESIFNVLNYHNWARENEIEPFISHFFMDAMLMELLREWNFTNLNKIKKVCKLLSNLNVWFFLADCLQFKV